MNSVRRNSQVILAGLLLICTAYAQQPAAPAQSAAAMPAQAPGASTEELQKAVQNPIASLISAPFQNNNAFGIGPYDRTQDVLNIQPVIPVGISKNWNMITRIIQPIIWQPYPNSPTGGEYGFGDMVPTFFFSPKNSGKLIWGVGPQFILPTATDHILGQGKVSMGPSVVALISPKTGAIGVLVSNDWSIAGSGSRPSVNQMTLQYFVNYNFKKGWYLSSSPILTANWNAGSGNVWVVPFGGGGGRVVKFGAQPFNINVQLFGNVVHPAGASPWGLRIQIALLFPKVPKK
jgi:hypothetical protein